MSDTLSDAKYSKRFFLKNLTWNISGFSRNIFNLLQIVEDEDPSLMSISEPWLHLSDAKISLESFLPSYNFFLNSEDRHDNLLSLAKSRAFGGTLVLWKTHLDPYITILKPVSSRILALVLDQPGFQISVHITIYLSTAGHDPQYVQDLALLQETINEVKLKYPDSVIYLRGDANASIIPRSNNKRDDLFKYFTVTNSLNSTSISHTTYHHFMNNGLSDSTIDVLLSSKESCDGSVNHSQESLIKILCSKTHACIDSNHDAIISSVSLKAVPLPTPSDDNVTAPRIQHTKHKVVWSEEGVTAYQNLLSQSLPSLKSSYEGATEAGSASVLFEVLTVF